MLPDLLLKIEYKHNLPQAQQKVKAIAISGDRKMAEQEAKALRSHHEIKAVQIVEKEQPSKTMSFHEYQSKAICSLRDETTLEMLALQLIDKIGNVAGHRYAMLNHEETDVLTMTEDLGWCLWCVAAIAHRLNISLNFSCVRFERGNSYFGLLASIAAELYKDFMPPCTVDLKCHSLKLGRSLRSLCVLAECSNISMDEVVALNLDLVSNGAAS